MPQMAPYNWLILFMMFNMLIFLMISHNHFMMTVNKLPMSSNLPSFKWIW